jgi:hypothetical protein
MQHSAHVSSELSAKSCNKHPTYITKEHINPPAEHYDYGKNYPYTLSKPLKCVNNPVVQLLRSEVAIVEEWINTETLSHFQWIADKTTIWDEKPGDKERPRL